MRRGARTVALPAVVLLAVALAGCASPDAPLPDGADPGPSAAEEAWSWTTRPTPRTARGEAGCAATEGTILVVGGFAEGPGNQVARSTELYDLAERSWQRGPDLPVPVHHTQVAAVDGTFHVLGGYAGPGFTATNAAFVWTPGQDGWQMTASLPAARGAGGAAVVGDRIVLVGGVGGDGQLLARVDVYDTGDGSWSRLRDLPTPRDHLAVDAVDGRVVAAQGRQQSFASNTARVEVLDVDADRWRRGPDAPTARGGVGGAPWNGSLVTVGGEESAGTFEEVAAYDPAGEGWRVLPPMPTPRHGLCVAALPDGIHTITGGREPGFAVSDVHEVLVPPNGTSGEPRKG